MCVGAIGLTAFNTGSVEAANIAILLHHFNTKVSIHVIKKNSSAPAMYAARIYVTWPNIR